MLDGVIQVNDNVAKDQFGTAFRYALMACGAGATAMGFDDTAGKFDDMLSIVGPVSTFVVFVWGQISSRRSAKIKRELAKQVPDSVAVVK